MRRVLFLIAAVGGLLTANITLAGASATEQGDWGQCEVFDDHCHCIWPVTEKNCSGDGDCTFGPCEMQT
jgi:hypothetical protein